MSPQRTQGWKWVHPRGDGGSTALGVFRRKPQTVVKTGHRSNDAAEQKGTGTDAAGEGWVVIERTCARCKRWATPCPRPEPPAQHHLPK